MATVLTRIHVDEQGRVTGQVPASVPPGDYTTRLEISDVRPLPDPTSIFELPIDDEPWDSSISLRREDLYGDDGR